MFCFLHFSLFGQEICQKVDIGAILESNLAILWVMLKLSRAMVSHEAICQILFGHVVLVSQSALPQKHQDFKWVLASYVLSLGIKCKDGSILFGPSLAIFGLLGYLEVTAMLLGATLGDLEGKLGYREVMLKLS